ncbi:hypothetical protein PFICI_10439 [Pestalotiopsis fici W106-1]|uniref:Heterokaryon incompatibility domain-containing protein n=1 Tax=Pestalotiopsis fici (strain W106-1 / CGMCC3.15140) TaxID=1229662 RepID=W3WZ33_PESFW|nr:uncharacterized protein PFICI_10439 [Pestalotiopsis fici W106-1]ETS78377.1 hypothetical protein PFICI_10439 [Pestalotiopsis fici W106-1]
MQKYNYEPLPPRHIRIATLHSVRDSGDTMIQITLRQAMFDTYNDDEIEDGGPIKDLQNAGNGKKPSLLSRMQDLHLGSRVKQMVKGRDNATELGYPLRLGSKKPRYEALSYSWGLRGAEPPVVMISDTRSQDAYPFQVSDNLLSALRRLRKNKKPRDLWVDQVCINQEDEEEKAVQVAMMGAIYANADAVLAWIGEETDDSQLAFSTFTNIGKFLSNPNNEPGLSFDEERPGLWLPDEPSPDALAAANEMLKRPWCSRLWIRQEIALAKQETAVIVCGSLTIPWKYFRAGGIYIAHIKNQATPIPFPVLAWGIYLFDEFLDRVPTGQIKGGDASLSVLREMSWGTGCADSRDRIFANRALLAWPDERQRLRPSYAKKKKKKKAPQVYQDAVVAYLNSHNDLVVLNQCRWKTLSSSEWGAPTWWVLSTSRLATATTHQVCRVPDWSDTNVPTMPKFFITDNGLKASVRLATPFKIEGNVLQVAGVHLGTVSSRISLSDAMTIENTLEEVQEFFASDSSSLCAHYCTNPAGVFTLGDAYIVSLSACDLDWSLPAPTHPHDLDGDLSQRLQAIRPWMSALGQASADASSVMPESLINCIRKARQHQTQLFRTSHGKAGLSWAPAMELGDCVWILFGCNVPMLLRPVASTNTGGMTADRDPHQYQVVGPAYLPWVSDGEPILGELHPKWYRFGADEFIDMGEGDDAIQFFAAMNEYPGVRVGPKIQAQFDPRLKELPFTLDTIRTRWPKTERLRDTFVNVPFNELETTLAERGVKVERLDLV